MLLKSNLEWFNRPNTAGLDGLGEQVENEACNELLEQSGGFLSNRPVIWQFGLDEFRQFKPVHLVGYGFRGQLVSGLSSQYSCLFKSYLRPQYASLHNIWLQILIDTGYLGLAITFSLAALLAYSLAKLFLLTGSRVFQGMLTLCLFIIMAGTMEASLSPDYYVLFPVFYILAVPLLFSEREMQPARKIEKS
jgi:O-antigen ligase